MKRKILFLSIILLSFSSLNAITITVGITGDYPTLSAASAFINAGDIVVLQSQTFSNGSQFLSDLTGTVANPIIIIAETEHSAIFQGGSEAIHLINCVYVELNGIIFEQQTSNGVNIDDGGDYATPSHHITIRNCIFRDIPGGGNHDLLKMSGVDDFLIENCEFTDGAGGGSGIDFVGCHMGTVQDCYFDNAGSSGIQNKGGSQFIRIQRNTFKNMGQRALNLGGNTELQYFRPPLPDPIVDAFEAADIDVFSNIFIGSWSPIAYVGCVRVKVINNTFYKPVNWAIRILQETTTAGFLPCSDNEYRNNIIYLENDITEVNIGNNTSPGTFIFTNNLWFNENDNSWSPVLPVVDPNQVIANPLFVDAAVEDFKLMATSLAIEAGMVLADPTTDFENVSYYNPPSSGAFESNPAALPIRIHEQLQAVISNEFVHLKWSTSTEINNTGFELHSSNNGQHWVRLGWVKGHDNSNEINQYRFIDKTPFSGNNYYRYKQIDIDGKYAYSKTVSLAFLSPEVSIYPNPSSSFINIRTNTNEKEFNIILYDQYGKKVLVSRENNGYLDISTLDNGAYMLSIESKSNHIRQYRLVIAN